MKKVFALILALVMVAACFVGCGKKEEKTVVVGYTIYEPMNYLDESGKLCLDRAGLTAFAHGEYYALGEVIGKFGFSAAKKKKSHPKGGKTGRAQK